MKLYCSYDLNGVLKTTEVDDILKVTQGFWIDDSGNFCETSTGAKIFIISHMIKGIRREEEEHCTEKDVVGRYDKKG